MYSGITSGRVHNWDPELLYTKILEVNLFAFAHRLFHEDFSSIDGTVSNLDEHLYLVLGISKLQKLGQERLRLAIQKPYQINIYM